jgi:hypothetical protein
MEIHQILPARKLSGRRSWRLRRHSPQNGSLVCNPILNGVPARRLFGGKDLKTKILRPSETCLKMAIFEALLPV